MRILFAGPFGFHPNKTMQARAFSLARELVQRGHQVKILMPPWQTPEEGGKSWIEDGVEIENVVVTGGVLLIWRRMVQRCLAWQPDIVHGFKPKAYSGLLLGWLWVWHRQRIKLLLDADDWEGWGGWNERGNYSLIEKYFFAWQEQWGLRHVHGVSVASRSLESLVWSMAVPVERVLYLPNGSGIRPVAGGEDVVADVDLLLYSRLFEFDVRRLVRILERVKTAVGHLKILFVGTALYPEDQKRLDRALEEAALTDDFVQLGWLPLEQVGQNLKRGKIALYLMDDHLLNRTKCPVKLVDLLSLGVPVVGENVGEVGVYIQHEENGLLYRSGDEAGISEGIITLLQDDEKRYHLQLGAKKKAGQYDWANRALELEMIYTQL